VRIEDGSTFLLLAPRASVRAVVTLQAALRSGPGFGAPYCRGASVIFGR
jgi:hypothetical protein